MTRTSARFWLATIIIGVGTGLVAMLLFKTVPESNQRIMDMGTGVILGWGSAVVMFFFGTSQSSADKNEIIREAHEAHEVDASNLPHRRVPSDDLPEPTFDPGEGRY